MLYVDGPLDEYFAQRHGGGADRQSRGRQVHRRRTSRCPPLLFTRSTRLTQPDAGDRAISRTTIGDTGDHARPDAPAERRVERGDSLRSRRSAPPIATPPPRSPTGRASGRTWRTSSSRPHARSAFRPATCPGTSVPPRRGGRAATHAAAHAWAEAYRGRLMAGSASILRTICCPDDAYVRVAVGLDYRDAAPVSGHADRRRRSRSWRSTSASACRKTYRTPEAATGANARERAT